MEIKVNIAKQEEKRGKLPKGITTTMGILSVLFFITSYLVSKITSSDMHFIIKEVENAFMGLSILFFFLFFIFLIARTEESD